MIKPDSGEWQLFGKTPKQVSWNDVGYLFETTNAYTNLSVVENLEVIYLLQDIYPLLG